METEKLTEEYFMSGEWLAIASKILKNKGVVLVLGATDSGKSAGTLLLANYWLKHGRRVGIVDGDMGQSHLGPPTTMGLVVKDKMIRGWEELSPDTLYFVGSTSPIHHFLPTICGTKKLVEEGKKKKAEIIIVDTTGLVKGLPGQTLKEYKIEIISPDHIIALQRKDELEPIIRKFKGNEEMIIYPLSPEAEIKAKTYPQRKEIREEKFRRYFKDSSFLTLHLNDLILRGDNYYGAGRALGEEDIWFLEKELGSEVSYAEKIGEGIFIITKGRAVEGLNDFWEIKKRFGAGKIIITTEDKYKNLLISLEDQRGFVISLGIIQESDFKRRIFTIFTPLKRENLLRVYGFKFGSMQIDLAGKELGKIRPGEI